jgi:3-phosphoshikimate 1-carboxyvinyltransferase
MNAHIVQAPSSKSVSHRAVLLAALAQGSSHLSRVLESEDLERTIDIMSRCGASIRRIDPGVYAIRGVNGRLYGGVDGPLYLDVGESGTTCRLIAALLAARDPALPVAGPGDDIMIYVENIGGSPLRFLAGMLGKVSPA